MTKTLPAEFLDRLAENANIAVQQDTDMHSAIRSMIIAFIDFQTTGDCFVASLLSTYALRAIACITGKPATDHVAALYTLWYNKHQDYGAQNISAQGVSGVSFRVQDKISRIHKAVFLGHELRVNDEGLLQSLDDIANYGVILELLLDGTWPAFEHKGTFRDLHTMQPIVGYDPYAGAGSFSTNGG